VFHAVVHHVGYPVRTSTHLRTQPYDSGSPEIEHGLIGFDDVRHLRYFRDDNNGPNILVMLKKSKPAYRVFRSNQGRWGNAIFRYFAAALFCNLHGATFTDVDSHTEEINVTEANFADLLRRTPDALDPTTLFKFTGFYQNFALCREYRRQLIARIESHPADALTHDAAGMVPWTREHSKLQKNASSLLEPPGDIPTYGMSVHVRLEDFAPLCLATHPNSLCLVIEQAIVAYPEGLIALVMNTPQNEAERRYVATLQNHPTFGTRLQLESNDPTVDFHIMKQSPILVCSLSTLSWAAAVLSDQLHTLYFPCNGLNMNQKPPTTANRVDGLTVHLYDNRLCSSW
jgi:hypothetical protein